MKFSCSYLFKYLYNFISAVIVTIVVIGIMIAVTKFGRAKRKKKIHNAVNKRVREIKKEEKAIKKNSKKKL